MPRVIVLEDDDEDTDDRDLSVHRDTQEDLVRVSGLPTYEGPTYPPDQDD